LFAPEYDPSNGLPDLRNYINVCFSPVKGE
jgi:hypothetical protein